MDHRAFVTGSCVRLLGCPADEAGLAHSAARLDDGSLNPSSRVVQAIDDCVWARHDTRPLNLRVDGLRSPHLLLTHDEAIFPSVFALEKRG